MTKMTMKMMQKATTLGRITCNIIPCRSGTSIMAKITSREQRLRGKGNRCWRFSVQVPNKISFSTAKTSSIATAKTKTTLFGERLWNKYTDALIARPLLVKCGTASFIFLISDAMTQKLLFSSKSSGDDDNDNDNHESFIWDYNRSLSGAGFGIIATCWLHYWWG